MSDLKKIPLKDNSVDLILSTSVLEHIEFPDIFFSESFRVLKPGGSLYINVPFAYEEHEIPYDFQRPTRYGLNRYYSHAGFEKISVFPTSSSIYSAQYFFFNAIKEDSKRLGYGILSRILQSISIATAKAICKTAMYLFDKGPINETVFPIGWVAKGYKKGVKDNHLAYPSKKDFMKNNAQCCDMLFLEDGRIIPVEYR